MISRSSIDPPRRVAERPSPSQWGCTELMTLTEAAALYWPHGPLTVKSLRTAIRNGELPVAIVARRHFVTKEAIAEMTKPTRKRAVRALRRPETHTKHAPRVEEAWPDPLAADSDEVEKRLRIYREWTHRK